MMNYETFKEYMAEKLLDFLPNEFKTCEVKLESVNKTNQTLDSLRLIPSNSKESTAYPAIYLNHMYEEYSTGKSIQEVMEAFVQAMKAAYQTIPDNISHFNFSDAENKIVLMLINTEQNKKMLEEIPHREFLDLSIIYRYVLSIREEGIQSVLINNSHAEYLGMTEEQLYEAAIRNTRQIFPTEIRSMSEIARNIFLEEGMSEENVELMLGETEYSD